MGKSRLRSASEDPAEDEAKIHTVDVNSSAHQEQETNKINNQTHVEK